MLTLFVRANGRIDNSKYQKKELTAADEGGKGLVIMRIVFFFRIDVPKCHQKLTRFCRVRSPRAPMITCVLWLSARYALS